MELDLLKLFKNADPVVDVSAGTILFEQGQPGNQMYVVLEGSIEVMVNGRPVEKAGPGDLVGEMALIDSRGRSATAVATMQSRVAPVSQDRFLYMVQQTPYFAVHVMKLLVERLRRADRAVRS
jgi:CRP-like cAMP-binding protein